MPTRAEAQERIFRNRWVGHQLLFAESHDNEPSPAHQEMVRAFWSDDKRLIFIGFRGLGKSTLAEEAIAIAACEEERADRPRLFHHALIVGPSETRAVERLEAIKAHIELNDQMLATFGDMRSIPWQETRIALKNKVVMSAMGVGQKIRGIKRFAARPDFILVDDFEDEENILTPDARRKILRWFLRTLRLAVHPQARWRVLTTLLDADAVPIRLEREAGWPVRRFPVSYLDENGVEQATWPARFPMSWVQQEREEYVRLGELGLWDLEMACDSSVETGAKDFLPQYFAPSSEPIVRTWQPVYVVFDPARTKTASSASTGIVVFSWIGQRLVVWEDRTGFYLPSEMIEIMFELEAKYQPVAIGFERDGLEEWAMSMIRGEALKRGIFLPIKPLRAPRDKLSFIRGLEAYARNGQLVFAGDFKLLREQFLAFPRGRVDGPNALAYGQILRPGTPVYDGFDASNIALDLPLAPWRPAYLACNARDGWVCAALVQFIDQQLRVIADWAYLGSPDEHVETIASEARLIGTVRKLVDPPVPQGLDALKMPDFTRVERRAPPLWIIGESHFDKWLNVGLEQSVRRLPARAQKGGELREGRAWIKAALERTRHGEPGVLISQTATWSLRAFSAGYAHSTTGIEAETGQYRCLAEALESWAGLLAVGFTDEDEETEPANYSYDRAGRRYQSILPSRH